MNRPHKELPFGLPAEPRGSKEPPAVPRVSNTDEGTNVSSTVGTLVSNGDHMLLIPEAELKEIDRMSEKSDDDFDWSTNDAVVLTEQPATAIYFNSKGCLVIRQEGSWNDNDDPFVFIAPQNIQEFIDKLTDKLGIGGSTP